MDSVAEAANGAEGAGSLVQRWLETGEVANEVPVHIGFAIEGGFIRLLELRPTGAS